MAVTLGYIPDCVDVLSLCNEELDRMRGQYVGSNEFLLTARSEEGWIKGTQVPFPDDGPSSKYTALFDPRPVFDLVREAFMVAADPCLPFHAFQRSLKRMLDENMCTGVAWEVATSCYEKVLHLCETDEGLTEPHDFAERAWNAYVHCVCKRTTIIFLWTSYY